MTEGPQAPLNVLILEDRSDDIVLLERIVERECGSIRSIVARTRDEYEKALDGPIDIILADYTVPGYGGLDALAARNARLPTTPFIIVSGTIGDERAVECVRQGATDFILKDRLARLGPAIHRALDEARTVRRARALAAEIARSAVDRDIARWIVRELVRSRNIPESAIVELGRQLAARTACSTTAECVRTFSRLGLGQLVVVEDAAGRLVVEGEHLFEHEPGSKTLTCFLTAGFLVGASEITFHGRARGSEVACQSRGDPKCRFVVVG